MYPSAMRFCQGLNTDSVNCHVSLLSGSFLFWRLQVEEGSYMKLWSFLNNQVMMIYFHLKGFVLFFLKLSAIHFDSIQRKAGISTADIFKAW